MVTAFSGGRLLIGERFEEASLLVRDGAILDVVGAGDIPSHAVVEPVDGRLVAPGYIDTQVNGGGGFLFNDSPTVESIAAIGAAHRRFGTTGFLPTLISDDLATVARAIAATTQAIAQGVPGVLGLHIEGPFLNPERRGIHDARYFRVLDDAALALLEGPRAGLTLMTIAPETTSPAMISRLRDAGIIVAAGHTNATFAQMREAYAAGVTGMTHLFNAMSPLTSREPGAVGAALASPAVHCGLIVDGIHVHPEVLRIALAAGPRERFFLVTDAMPSVGTDASSFLLNGQTIFVRDGRCVDGNGVLAGSTLTMADAVRNSVTMLGMSPAEAIGLASANPAAFLGLNDRGQLAPAMAADLVLLDLELRVSETWIGGVRYAWS